MVFDKLIPEKLFITHPVIYTFFGIIISLLLSILLVVIFYPIGIFVVLAAIIFLFWSLNRLGKYYARNKKKDEALIAGAVIFLLSIPFVFAFIAGYHFESKRIEKNKK